MPYTSAESLETIQVADEDLWLHGPPYELFERDARRVPGALDGEITQYPDEAGFWSVTTAEDVHAVSRDWETYSSELGGVTVFDARSSRWSSSGRCSSAWTRPSTTASRRSSSAASRPSGSPTTRTRSARSRSDVLDRLEGARRCDLVARGRPAGRLAGDRQLHGHRRGGRRDLGAADELLAGAGRPRPRARRASRACSRRTSRRCSSAAGKLIAERRENPTDDLTSVLVHAEVDGEKLEETRDRDGLLPADGRRQRLDQGDLLQRHAGADGKPGPAARAGRRPLADPGRGRGGAADVPGLRPLPPHRHHATPSWTASRSRRARRW